MAFVNEYISQEDIEKYGLEELWEKAKVDKKFYIDDVSFTIDREKEIFLMYVYNRREPDEDRQRSRESVWMLHYKGSNFRVILCKSINSIAPKGPLIDVIQEKEQVLREGKIFDSIVFLEIWDLISIEALSMEKIDEKELKSILKESLEKYGHSGVHNKPILVQNTRVQCNW